MNKDKKGRTLKVVRAMGYEYREEVPRIILQGKWLKDSGFLVGESVKVICETDKIIILKL